MEALINQYFEFNCLSRTYAEFLIECSNSYPGGRVERVPIGLYPNKEQDIIQVNFQSPESIAVLLRLKFGAHLRERPVPDLQDIHKIMNELCRFADMYETKKISDIDRKYGEKDL